MQNFQDTHLDSCSIDSFHRSITQLIEPLNMSLHDKMRQDEMQRGFDNPKYLEDSYSSDMKSESNQQKSNNTLDQTEVIIHNIF